MRVVITGGAGFIGWNLIKHLASMGGYKIAIVDDLSAVHTLPPLPTGIDFIRGDFADPAILASVLPETDAIVHLAALSGVIDSINDPSLGFEINVVGTFRLLEAARKAGVKKVICASTGGALLGDVTPPILETMAPCPLSPYGASKLAVEGYCSAFAGAYGLRCTALRFSNVYGPHSAHKKSVVAAFIKRMLLRAPLRIYGDGSQQRDLLYVGDLVAGIRSALERDVTGTYQLGSGQPTSLNQLVAALEIISARKLPLDHCPARRGEVKATWCEVSKARSELGFSTPTTLEKGLRATFDWFMTNRDVALAQVAVSPD